MIELNSNEEMNNEHCSNDLDTDYLIDSIDNSIDKIKYGLYQKIRSYIFYFNRTKEKTKKQADKWLVTGVIATVYLSIVGEPGLPIPNDLAILLTQTSIMLCISSLWFKECYILHRYIRVLYEVITILEKENPRLGKPFSNMTILLHSKILDPNVVDGFYYVSLLSIIQIMILGAAFFVFEKNIFYIIMLIIIILIMDITLLIVSKYSGSSMFKKDKIMKKGDL